MPAWVARIVRDVTGSPVAALEAVIVCPASLEPRSFLYELYTTLDARKFRAPTDPFAPVDLAPLVAAGVSHLDVVPRATADGDELDRVALERDRVPAVVARVRARHACPDR